MIHQYLAVTYKYRYTLEYRYGYGYSVYAYYGFVIPWNSELWPNVLVIESAENNSLYLNCHHFQSP